jgi:hypothetical protein
MKALMSHDYIHSVLVLLYFFEKRISTFLPEVVSVSYFSVCIIRSEVETIGR